MKKRILIAGVAVIGVLAAVIIPKILKPEIVQEALIPVVEAQKPQYGDIRLYRSLVGSVEPSDVVYTYPKMAGEVTQIHVKTGDVVKEGQLLCVIDTKQVDSARLNMEAAQTALQDARTNLERQRELFAAGDISSLAWEQAQSSAKNAQIQYDSAKLNYDHQMEYSNITATIGGKIEKFDVELHDNISQQNLICVISGEGSKAITFSVPEKIAGQLQPGTEVVVKKNGSEFPGSVTEISSMVDNSTGLFKVKASVENGEAIPTGSTVSLSVISEQAEHVMVLPVDTVYYSGGDAFVYLYDNGTVRERPVEVGIYDSEKIEILSGITMEDQVITTWSSELFEGSAVQLMQATHNEQETAATEQMAE